MNFSAANGWLANLAIARRASWPEGVWITRMPEQTIYPERLTARTQQVLELIFREPMTKPLHTEAYFAMWTFMGTWRIGWQPLPEDQAATDWEVRPSAAAT